LMWREWAKVYDSAAGRSDVTSTSLVEGVLLSEARLALSEFAARSKIVSGTKRTTPRKTKPESAVLTQKTLVQP